LMRMSRFSGSSNVSTVPGGKRSNASSVGALLEPENLDTLIDILTFHVYGGDVYEDEVTELAGTSVNMLNDKDLRIDVSDGSVILSLNGNRQAMVTVTDILTSNGVIHVIDTVLDPGDATKNIIDTAEDNGNFNTLVAAVEAAGLTETLSGPGPFTVFAPTDSAFETLPAGTVEALLDPENLEILVNILTFHVYNGDVYANDVVELDGRAVRMLNDLDLRIDVESGTVVLNQGGNREADVIITNVLTSNGVIHVIDTVLDPDDSM